MDKPSSEVSGTPPLRDLHVALYQWALERGRLDPAKAAMRMGIPMADIDAAVHDLAQLHLLRWEWDGHNQSDDLADPDDPREPDAPGYVPASPDAAAAHLVGPIEAEIQKRHREAERLRNHVMSMKSVFEDSWKSHFMRNPIERLTLLDTVRSTLARLSAGARIEVAAAHPRLPAQDVLEEGLARTADVIDRGITMRTIYPHSVLAHQYMQQHLTKMVALGALVRTVGHIPDRVIFFDSETAVIADPRNSGGDAAIAIRDPSLVDHLYRSWESTWDSGRPFTSAPHGIGYGAAKDELRRSVVQLLESGMKDEVAARRLSMSISSYRRHVTDLMNDLGAESRFQAGSYAHRSGWFDN